MPLATAISARLRRWGRKCPWRQVCALLTLIGFSAGLCGLPASVKPVDAFSAANENAPFVPPMANASPEEEAASAEIVALSETSDGCCRCAPALRQANGCCCSGGGAATGARSCCERRHESPRSAPSGEDEPSSTVGWVGCPCGSFSGLLILVCGEPRLLSDDVALESLAAWNGSIEAAAPRIPLRSLSPETPPPRQAGC